MQVKYLQIKMPENIPNDVLRSKWTSSKIPLMFLDVKKLKEM